MLYQIKTLMAVLILQGLGLFIASKALPESVISKEEFKRAAKASLAIVAWSFLSNSYMLYAIGCIAIVWWHQKHGAPLWFFAAGMYLVPPVDYMIPGIGPIGVLAYVNHIRILSLCILLPYLIKHQQTQAHGNGTLFCDSAVVGLGVITLASSDADLPITESIRYGLYYATDILLPYFVLSRIKDTAVLFKFVCGLAFAIAMVSVWGVYEFAKGWLMFDQVGTWLGVPNPTRFLIRGDTGWLRTFATTGHALVMGFVCTVGLFVTLGISPPAKSNKAAHRWWWVLAAVMCGGLFASLARGSWIGAALGMATWMFINPQAMGSKFVRMGFALVALAVLAATPAGQKIVDTLPFIGNADQDNVAYRRQLIDVSWIVIQENFWFGNSSFMNNPLIQTLKQGQGIIDIVNIYLSYWLSNGLVGMLTFAAPLLFSFFTLLGTLLATRQKLKHEMIYQLGCALCSAMLATMLILATSSAVGSFSVLYTVLCALSLATRSILQTEHARLRPRLNVR
jgi:O-Antigen ligase